MTVSRCNKGQGGDVCVTVTVQSVPLANSYNLTTVEPYNTIYSSVTSTF